MGESASENLKNKMFSRAENVETFGLYAKYTRHGFFHSPIVKMSLQ